MPVFSTAKRTKDFLGKFLTSYNGRLQHTTIQSDGSVINVPIGNVYADPINSGIFGKTYSSGSKTLVSNGFDSVSVMDLTTNTLSTKIQLGNGISPDYYDLSSSGTKAVVVNQSGTGYASIIDLSTNALLTFVTCGSDPRGVAVSADGTKAVVVNYTSGTASIINLSTYAVTGLSCGSNPYAVAITPDGTKAVVANFSSANATIINLSNNTVAATVACGTNPFRVAITPDGSKAVVTNNGAGTATVINLTNNTAAATITCGTNPQTVAVINSKAVIANYGSGNATIVNLSNNTVAATVTCDAQVSVIGITPDGSKAIVASTVGNNVKIINLTSNAVVSTITCGGLPGSGLISADGAKLYVNNSGTRCLSVIDLSSYTETSRSIPYMSINTCKVTPDGSRAVLGNGSSQGYVSVNLISGNESPSIIPAINHGGIYEISSDGKFAVCRGTLSSSTTNGGVFIVDIEANSILHSFETSTLTSDSSGTVTDIKISKDSTYAMVLVSLVSTNNGMLIRVNFSDYSKSNSGNLGNGATSSLTQNTMAFSSNGAKIFAVISGLNLVYSFPVDTLTSWNSIAVGASPRCIAITPDNGKAFVSNLTGNSVTVFNPANNSVITTVTSVTGAQAITISPDGANAIVSGSSSAVIIDTSTYAKTTVNSLFHSGISRYTASSDSKWFIAPTSNLTGFSIVNASNKTAPAHKIITGSDVSNGLAISPDGTRAVISQGTLGNALILNLTTETLAATVTCGSSCRYPAISNTKAVVPNFNLSPNNTATIINLSNNTVAATVTCGSRPIAVAITPDGTKAVVANYSDATATVINLSNNTVTATVNCGTNPYAVAITPDGTKAVVANYGAGTASVITLSNNSVAATVTCGTGPYRVAITPDGTKAVVINQSTNNATIINMSNNSVIATVACASNPLGLAISPDSTKAVVTNSSGNNLSIINLLSNTSQTIACGSSPASVAITGDSKRAFVVLGGGGISVIDLVSSKLINTLTGCAVANHQQSIALTPDGSKFVSSDNGSGYTSIIYPGRIPYLVDNMNGKTIMY